MIRHSFVLFCMLIAVFSSAAAEAARPRRLSAAQIKKNQEQVAFMQLEMMRYQSEMTAKQQEVYRSFDENGNGHLEGGEKARFDKRMHAIQTGAEPNPFAALGSTDPGDKNAKKESAGAK